MFKTYIIFNYVFLCRHVHVRGGAMETGRECQSPGAGLAGRCGPPDGSAWGRDRVLHGVACAVKPSPVFLLKFFLNNME